MRLIRLAPVLSLIALLATPATAVHADHCGADATIRPTSGPPGTTFVFKTNLGSPSNLHVYRDGALVMSVSVDDSDFFSHAIKTGPGDAGAWRARAEVRGQTECAAEATFTVVGMPNTSTEPASPSQSGLAWLLLSLLVGGVAFVVALYRSRLVGHR